MFKTILHVDLDAFFASVEQRDDSRLRGKPVVIGADPKGGRGRGVVSTCSYEARPFGIRSAMPISKAFHLCPHAIFVQPHFEKYNQASRKVFAIFNDFTPHIQGLSIDEAFLDITTSHHLFGGPVKTAKYLKERVRKEVGLTASVGIAPVNFVAKIASDLSKPDGLLEVSASRILDFLHPLPIERLWGVGPKTAESLHRLGIQTIGQLSKFSLADMQKTYGDGGEHLYNLSRGIDPREVKENIEVKSISHEHTFDCDTGNGEVILATLLDLSEQVSRRLRKDDLKGKTITIKIRLKDFSTFTRAVTLRERTNYTDVIFMKAKDLFKNFFKTGMQIRLIGIRVNNFVDAYVQDSLFSNPVDERLEKIHSAVDLIKNKFGESAIGRGK